MFSRDEKDVDYVSSNLIIYINAPVAELVQSTCLLNRGSWVRVPVGVQNNWGTEEINRLEASIL